MTGVQRATTGRGDTSAASPDAVSRPGGTATGSTGSGTRSDRTAVNVQRANVDPGGTGTTPAPLRAHSPGTVDSTDSLVTTAPVHPSATGTAASAARPSGTTANPAEGSPRSTHTSTSPGTGTGTGTGTRTGSTTPAGTSAGTPTAPQAHIQRAAAVDTTNLSSPSPRPATPGPG
ncbi:hypothetical protein PV367_47645, partial [Streptomyces europaeiscabiei]|nr:hypothetical protein [Streptomyces europaeiscabiei]